MPKSRMLWVWSADCRVCLLFLFQTAKGSSTHSSKTRLCSPPFRPFVHFKIDLSTLSLKISRRILLVFHSKVYRPASSFNFLFCFLSSFLCWYNIWMCEHLLNFIPDRWEYILLKFTSKKVYSMALHISRYLHDLYCSTMTQTGPVLRKITRNDHISSMNPPS